MSLGQGVGGRARAEKKASRVLLLQKQKTIDASFGRVFVDGDSEKGSKSATTGSRSSYLCAAESVPLLLGSAWRRVISRERRGKRLFDDDGQLLALFQAPCSAP